MHTDNDKYTVDFGDPTFQEEEIQIPSFVYITATGAKWMFDEKEIVLKMKHVWFVCWIIKVELLNNFGHIDFDAAHRDDVVVRAREVEMQHESIYYNTVLRI